jgi:hypothetical protein
MQMPKAVSMYRDCPSMRIEVEQSTTFFSYYKMKRWILLAFVGLTGCNSYVDSDWYNKPGFTEHLATLYAYPSVPVTTSRQ